MCGKSSELQNLDTHVKRVCYIALDILEYAQETQDVFLFDEILLATNDLIPSKEATFISAEMRAKIEKVHRLFMVNVGDLLEQDIPFAWKYNCISQKTDRKYERFNAR